MKRINVQISELNIFTMVDDSEKISSVIQWVKDKDVIKRISRYCTIQNERTIKRHLTDKRLVVDVVYKRICCNAALRTKKEAKIDLVINKKITTINYDISTLRPFCNHLVPLSSMSYMKTKIKDNREKPNILFTVEEESIKRSSLREWVRSSKNYIRARSKPLNIAGASEHIPTDGCIVLTAEALATIKKKEIALQLTVQTLSSDMMTGVFIYKEEDDFSKVSTDQQLVLTKYILRKNRK